MAKGGLLRDSIIVKAGENNKRIFPKPDSTQSRIASEPWLPALAMATLSVLGRFSRNSKVADMATSNVHDWSDRRLIENRNVRTKVPVWEQCLLKLLFWDEYSSYGCCA